MSEFMRGLQAFERLVKSDEGVRTGSCGKCGGSGHLTYECRNMIKLDAPAAKPKVSSRFGFLRKQLPATASPTAGSASSSSPTAAAVTGGSDKKADSRSNKDTKSSSRHKKKRRSSVSSGSGSDSRSDSELSDSASSSGSDSEEERRRQERT
ncbi:hypothetical protein BGZ95_001915 [Linnemannia exigua]|uniref:CCHC-type domain-containing protein n=1 Tax=Linnemannia exigua TaxID=604196 RepID=A0AAD4D8C3_9FUNG|nr:hypothetical protein BGZ95_001915 [Linnemannia exigua]